MKLIPMSDFVLEQAKQFDFDGHPQRIKTLEKYAKFLKQPLTLPMFVPCDENDNVIEPPSTIEFLSPATEKEAVAKGKLFAIGKEKVLFKGFSIQKQNYTSSHLLELVDREGEAILHYNSSTKEFYDLSEEEYLISNIELFIEYAGAPTLT